MFIIPLLAALIASAVDLWEREIPDTLSVGCGVLGIGCSLAGMSTVTWGLSLVSGLLVAAVLGLRGGFGGGDVKLMAGLATWLSLAAAVAFLFWTAIAGLLLSVIAVAWKQRDLAYGPAIAVGFFLAAYQPNLLPRIVESIRSTFGIQ